MWPQGFLHCSPSPRGADSAPWRIAEPSPGSRDGLWGHHSPPNGDIAASEPQIRSVWGTATSFCHGSAGRGPGRDSVQLAEFVAATGLLSITLDAVGRDLAAGPGISPVFWHTSLGLGFAGREMHRIYIHCGGEESIWWKSGWIGASGSDFFKISPRSKNSKCTNLQRMMGYFEGYVGSGSQHQGRENRAFCWISAKTWLGTVICITLCSPESSRLLFVLLCFAVCANSNWI